MHDSVAITRLGEARDKSVFQQAGIRSLAILSADSETVVSFRAHMIEALLAQGVRVSYVGAPVDAATRDWFTARGIPVVEVPINRNTLTPIADLRTLVSWLRALRSIKPDAVLALRIKAAVYGLIAAWLAGVPYRFVLITGLGYAFTEQPGNARWRLVNRVVRWLYRISLWNATAVAFQNTDDERDFRKWGLLRDAVPSKVVNGSGVDMDYYAVSELPERMSCLFAARLLTDKGVGEFIEAARLVKKERPEAVFTVLGPTETNPSAFPMERLRAEAEAGVVVYGGAVKDIRPFMRAARIFVQPSYYREGIPRSILEAMSMGRPVVTTDVTGCRDPIVPGRNGLLVPSRETRALADAILRIANDPQMAIAMGKEGRKIAEEKYEIGKVTHELLSFFGQTAAKHAGRDARG